MLIVMKINQSHQQLKLQLQRRSNQLQNHLQVLSQWQRQNQQQPSQQNQKKKIQIFVRARRTVSMSIQFVKNTTNVTIPD